MKKHTTALRVTNLVQVIERQAAASVPRALWFEKTKSLESNRSVCDRPFFGGIKSSTPVRKENQPDFVVVFEWR